MSADSRHDRSFGLTEAGPVEQRDRKIDQGRIQGIQLVAKTEAMPRRLLAAAIQELIEDILIELPGTLAVRVGERGLLRCLLQAKMNDLAETALETATDLPQAMRLGQLAKEHGDELIPAGESLGSMLGTGPLNGSLEVLAGEELQKLAKEAGYAYHQTALRLRGSGSVW